MSDRQTFVLQSMRGKTALISMLCGAFMAVSVPLFAQDGGIYDAEEAARFSKMSAKNWGPGGSLALDPGDGLLGNAGGIRAALADHGIAGYVYLVGTQWQNLLNEPTKTNGSQAYIGQKYTANALYGGLATYDLGRIGLPGAQIVVEATCSVSTYLPSYGRACRFLEAAIYDSFFRGKVEVSAGILPNDVEFVDTYVGGNSSTGAFGPAAILPVQSGLSQQPGVQPGLNVTYHLNGDWYDKLGVERSESPEGLVQEFSHYNRHGLTFSEPFSKALLIDELGYRKTPSPDQYSTYVRMGGLYNWTQYTDFRTGGTSQNWNVYLLGDRQLTRPEPARSYRGWYGGFSVMESPAKVDVFRSYYELRVYDISPFKSRPYDQFNIVGTYTKFSQDARQYFINLGAYPSQKDTTSVTTEYACKVAHGSYLQAGLSFVNNPSFVAAPREGHDLNFFFNYTIVL